MRNLSERQARNCEEALGKVCRCRCGGALHGAKRSGGSSTPTPRAFFEELDEEDPHYLPPKKRKPIQLSLPLDVEAKS
jgi:hypothetical protein